MKNFSEVFSILLKSFLLQRGSISIIRIGAMMKNDVNRLFVLIRRYHKSCDFAKIMRMLKFGYPLTPDSLAQIRCGAKSVFKQS